MRALCPQRSFRGCHSKPTAALAREGRPWFIFCFAAAQCLSPAPPARATMTRPRLTISNSARCRLELELEEACAANRHGHRLRGTVSGGCGLGEVVADDKTGQNRAPTETLLSRCVQTFELLRQHAAVVGGHPCGGVGFVPHDHRACSRAQAAGLLNRHDSLAALFDHRRRRLFLAHHSSTRSEHSTMIHMNRLRNPRFRADNELLFQPE